MQQLTSIFIFLIISTMKVSSAPINVQSSQDHLSKATFLDLFLSNQSYSQNKINDINKKEAPRIHTDSQLIENDAIINTSLNHQTSIVRHTRSNNDNNNDLLQSDSNSIQSRSIIEGDDLEVAGSGYYRDNEHSKGDFTTNSFGKLLNSEDESPKIIGVRVTSSVAIARGHHNNLPSNNQPQHNTNDEVPQGRKIKSNGDVNRFANDNPTTWRPLHFRPINRDYYKGVPSTRHSISTLPEAALGANPDFIQQQRRRELLRKKEEIMHPYQRAIIYQNQRPRSFSYSSVLNNFGDNTHSTSNTWGTSTQADSVATESSAGYVTIVDHNDDGFVSSPKIPYEDDNNLKISDIKEHVTNNNQDSVHIQPPPVPHVYSEPAKIYSEPAKIYGEPAKVYGKQEQVYSEPAKFYSEPAKVYGEPSKIYGEPSKVYGEPAKVYGEPSKVYSQPATVYPHAFPSDHFNSHVQPPVNNPTKRPESDDEYNKIFIANHQNNNTSVNTPQVPKRKGEQNYEVDEMTNVKTNGRTHGVQEKPDDGKKVGYVVEGRNYRKYRVEERTSDGFIVGEYGVVSHDDGSLRGVRYTADGTTNPRLIHEALMKFLSL